jgi:CHAD domain-containing protein
MQALGLAAERAREFVAALDEVFVVPAPEAVHGARVASRRLEQALVLLRGRLPEAQLEKARKAVKRLRRLMGRLRDTDVSLGWVGKLQAREDLSEPERLALVWMGAGLVRARFQQAAQLRKAQNKGHEAQRWRRRVEALGRSCEAMFAFTSPPEATVEPAPEATVSPAPEAQPAPAPEVLFFSEEIVAEAERLRDELRAELQARPLDTSDEGLERAHALRVEVKRYRYTVEALTERLPRKRAKAILEPFRMAQEWLGQTQDVCVLLGRLADQREDLPAELSAQPGCEHLDLAAGMEAMEGRLRGELGGWLQEAQTSLDAAHEQLRRILD